jgi:hypothetical protein
MGGDKPLPYEKVLIEPLFRPHPGDIPRSTRQKATKAAGALAQESKDVKDNKDGKDKNGLPRPWRARP